MRPTCNNDGFALVEAVIALAIVAAMLGITFQTIARAQRTAADTEARRFAMLEARSILAQVGATIPLVPGNAQGVSGPWVWHVEIAADAGEHPQHDVPIDRVAISVEDGASRKLAHLETLRLAR